MAYRIPASVVDQPNAFTQHKSNQTQALPQSTDQTTPTRPQLLHSRTSSRTRKPSPRPSFLNRRFRSLVLLDFMPSSGCLIPARPVRSPNLHARPASPPILSPFSQQLLFIRVHTTFSRNAPHSEGIADVLLSNHDISRWPLNIRTSS
jgi:hypothetical protein